jgi:hypothetical protein
LVFRNLLHFRFKPGSCLKGSKGTLACLKSQDDPRCFFHTYQAQHAYTHSLCTLRDSARWAYLGPNSGSRAGNRTSKASEKLKKWKKQLPTNQKGGETSKELNHSQNVSNGFKPPKLGKYGVASLPKCFSWYNAKTYGQTKYCGNGPRKRF